MIWPTVSIGIPTWNRAGYLPRAIESILSQDYARQVEVVVVDDGSTDDTGKVIMSYGNRISHVIGSHFGIAHAKNEALTYGSGEIRGLLDDDDWYEAQFVRRCVETLLENRERGIGVVYTDDVLYEDEKFKPYFALDWDLTGLLETCNLRTGGWLGWWDVINKTRLHDERLESDEDYDLIYQLAQVTDLMRLPEPLHIIRRHTGCMTQQKEKTTYWHAAVLAKHGFSVGYAHLRAARHGVGDAWNQVIADGYAFGKKLRAV